MGITALPSEIQSSLTVVPSVTQVPTSLIPDGALTSIIGSIGTDLLPTAVPTSTRVFLPASSHPQRNSHLTRLRFLSASFLPMRLCPSTRPSCPHRSCQLTSSHP